MNKLYISCADQFPFVKRKNICSWNSIYSQMSTIVRSCEIEALIDVILIGSVIIELNELSN